jgi:hypothetical protein
LGDGPVGVGAVGEGVVVSAGGTQVVRIGRAALRRRGQVIEIGASLSSCLCK